MALTDDELLSLKRTRANLIERLEEVSLVVGPTYTVGNQTVDKITYLQQLRAEIVAIDADIDVQEAESDYWEVRSQVWG